MSGVSGSMTSTATTTTSAANVVDSNGAFQRIPSESSLLRSKNGAPESTKPPKPWERSQSALDLENNRAFRSSSVDYADGAPCGMGGKVSEHSKVYWDLSRAEDERATTCSGGKFKISLQTIHQKEEMKSSGSPSVSIQARVVRRMASETSLLPPRGGGSSNSEYAELTLPAGSSSPPLREGSQSCSGGSGGGSGGGPNNSSQSGIPSPCTMSPNKTSKAELTFSFHNQQGGGKPNLTIVLANAVPVLKENIRSLRAPSVPEQCRALQEMLIMIEEAWATPAIGRDLAYGLCDVLRDDGGLDILIENCTSSNYEVQLGSAKVLEQSMTVGNRDVMANRGLEIIVNLAKTAQNDLELMKVATGIMESLFKHSEITCTNVIKLGGLDSILYSCRTKDTMTLRHCAEALANLAMFGGEENQHEMILHKAAEWLFPLAFSNDDSVRYYAFLAITALSANKELESAVAKSGTLELVQPFIVSHDPAHFAQADQAHIHGQSKNWLRQLVKLLDSRREEAQSLAAFHFAMEAGIKADQGQLEIFHEIGAVEPLKHIASSTNKLASKFASQALQIIGEQIPYKLSQQVPIWTVTDVRHWLEQIGFESLAERFADTQVDGDILLSVTQENLRDDLNMQNAITRQRFIRELKALKMAADYQSCDPSHLEEWIKVTGVDLTQYAYSMLKAGVDRHILRYLTDDHLRHDCGIENGIHRMRILEAAKRVPFSPEMLDTPMERPLDVFISYRRSTGSQLASLLKVHLQLRGFTVFLDIEKLRAGKFDDNLLNSVRNARHFILVLTPNSLDRCINDFEQKDWVHKEVVAAIEGCCNIIPVMDNFQFPAPEQLPEDMRPICFFNGIRWIHDYQDACVDKLERFLSGELSVKTLRPALSKGSSLGSETHGAAVFRMGGSTDDKSPP